MILEPRQRLTWWIALAIFILSCAAAWAAFVDFDHERSTLRAESELVALTYQAAEHARRAIASGEEIVLTIARRAAGQDLRDPEVDERLHEDLVAAVAGVPQITAVWVLDAEGINIADTWGTPLDPTASFADRDYFTAHLADRPGLHIGEATLGSVTGEMRFTLSTAIPEPDGGLGGVVVAGIYSSHLAQVYETMARIEGARILLRREDGALLAAWPPSSGADAANGGGRLTRTLAVAPYPVAVEVSWPTIDVLGPWRERAIATGLAALLVIVAFSGLTWLGLRIAGSERRARSRLAAANTRLETLLESRTEDWAESERRHRFVTDALPALIGFVDREQRYRFTNACYEQWMGRSKGEMLGRTVREVIGEPGYARIRARVEAALTGERVHYEAVVTYPKRGAVPIEADYIPQFDRDGNVEGFYTFIHSIADRVEAERQRELLIGELNHRVKNTLATVQSLALQSFRGSDPKLVDARHEFEGRLMVLARAHDLLTQRNWRGADLEETIRSAVGPHHGESGVFALDGPALQLSPRESLGFTMALHELCTNAAKYGALSRESGRIHVAWELDGEARLNLTWSETGGPAATAPEKTGFGMRLINRLIRELRGSATFDFRPEGLVCIMEVPLKRAGDDGDEPADDEGDGA